MSITSLAASTGLMAVIGLAGSTHAAPTMFAVVTDPSQDPWLAANGLQSAVIRINGFNAGDRYQGFIGAPAWNWNIATDGPGIFWNIDSVEDPGDPGSFLFEDGFYAAPTNNGALNVATGNTARWDSGLLGDRAILGNPSGYQENDLPGGFALFSDSSDDVNIVPVVWLNLAKGGVAVPDSALGNGPGMPVMRLTWSASESVNVHIEFIMAVPETPVYFNINIPAIPAPGAWALFGLAGVRLTRRRHGAFR